MGLKIAEAFKDRCYITVLATGLPATLLADIICTVIDESGNRAALVVTEESDGWYTAPFTPDIVGTWATEWSKTLVPENYVFHYPYKEFKVGGGQEDDIYTRLGAPAGVSVSADVATVKAETALTVADTNELQTDWHDGGRLDLLIDAILTGSGTAAAYAIVNSGLGFRGTVTAVPGANQFTIGTLIGVGAGAFSDATAPWYAYVFRDAGGVAGAPQGEYRQVTAYATATGAFTTAAFSAAVAAGDDVIITSNSIANILSIKARTDHLEITKTFFSTTDDIITCNTDSSDLTLPAVVLPNIAGTITHVYAGIKFRMIENTNAGTNGLNGAQDIQVKEDAAGAYTDAINLVDNQWLLAASTREGGDAVIGTIDIVAQVAAFNKTYDFIIDNNDVDQANLNLCDVQTFLIVSYY